MYNVYKSGAVKVVFKLQLVVFFGDVRQEVQWSRIRKMRGKKFLTQFGGMELLSSYTL